MFNAYMSLLQLGKKEWNTIVHYRGEGLHRRAIKVTSFREKKRKGARRTASAGGISGEEVVKK
jgi:hypothetical protein